MSAFVFDKFTMQCTILVPQGSIQAMADDSRSRTDHFLGLICCEICKISFNSRIEVNDDHRVCPSSVMAKNTEYENRQMTIV